MDNGEEAEGSHGEDEKEMSSGELFAHSRISKMTQIVFTIIVLESLLQCHVFDLVVACIL